jgi:site-specific DNA recombinase
MTRLRCAIYTRKSTDDGLEQDFNSLDAQREACEAYIRSQKGEGWKPVRTRYDDGGISGGTMDRPALQALLADIEARKVDMVLVYKVDRLTRSLTDFAKIVDVFDGHGVSFVSITQQFNTTTSMGRLTLNMLLSFAQFEREVTGERIRDKIAASRKKGMWMGGNVPLGYEAVDKKLIVNEAEADTVRTLFRLYLELGTVKALLTETCRLGLVTKRRRRPDGEETGGKPFTRGHLFQLLRNPLYVGDVSHKGARYPGQHEAIIDGETFDAVGCLLDRNAADRRSSTNAKAPSLLTGLLRDQTGNRLCPTHANKNGQRYRYYISKRLMHGTCETGSGWRLPAKELEDTITNAVATFLKDEILLLEALQLPDANPDGLRAALRSAATMANKLQDRQLLRLILHRVTICPDTLCITIRRRDLHQVVISIDPKGSDLPDGVFEFTVPYLLKRRGVEAKLVIGATENIRSLPDPNLINLLARAHQWRHQLVTGKAKSINEIAECNQIHPSDVGRNMQLAFLAPDIVEAVLAGRQPVALTAQRLKRIGPLPLEWDQQRQRLGFPA